MKISGAPGCIPCYEGAISERGRDFYCQTLLLRNKSTLAFKPHYTERREYLQEAF